MLRGTSYRTESQMHGYPVQRLPCAPAYGGRIIRFRRDKTHALTDGFLAVSVFLGGWLDRSEAVQSLVQVFDVDSEKLAVVVVAAAFASQARKVVTGEIPLVRLRDLPGFGLLGTSQSSQPAVSILPEIKLQDALFWP